MDINKIISIKKFIYIFLLLAISNNGWGYTKVGLSGGIGKPSSLKGYRINLATDLYKWKSLELELETSFAKWINNRHDINNLEVVSLGPMLRWKFYKTTKFSTFFQGSIAGARKSSTVVGSGKSGSKWTFQDILGFGINYKDKFSASISYLHYSNGSLANPNPGIDIIPLATVTVSF